MKTRHSIISRVLIAVVLVISAFSVVLAYNLASGRNLIVRLTRINDGYVPVTRVLDELHSDLDGFARVVNQDDPATLARTLRASLTLFPVRDRVEEKLADLRVSLDELRAGATSEDELNFLINVRSVIDLMMQENREIAILAEELLILADDSGTKFSAANFDEVHTTLGRRVNALRTRTADVNELLARHIDSAIANVNQVEKTARSRVLASLAVAALFALVVVYGLYRALSPIRQLTEAASRYKAGDYSRPAFSAGRDEIGLLASEFVEMASAIHDRDARLRKQKEELEAAYRALMLAQQAQVRVERLAAIGEISSRITHEIRNPLSSIGLNVEMLADELGARNLADEEIREILDSIEREISRLTTLTERYLGMARPDSNRARVGLHQIAGQVMRLAAAEFEKAGVKLEGEFSEAYLAADAEEIQQIMINLLRNALAAAANANSPFVRISSGLTEQRVFFRVDDNGPGIAADVAESIFEPFVSGNPRGTGLGLSISRRIATDHNGSLIMQSPGPLGGASFIFEAPEWTDSPPPLAEAN